MLFDRTTHNQALIVGLLILYVVGVFPFTMFLFWLVFGIYAAAGVPLLLAIWYACLLEEIYNRVKGGDTN